MVEFYVKVRPDSEGFSIDNGHIWTVCLENSAEQGRANAELIREMSDILGSKVAIISGHKSSRKKLNADISEEELERKLEEYLDQE